MSPGEIIHIQAASGAGKSTLIHILYGLRKDYTGTLRLAGQPMDQMNREELSRIRRESLSIVFQDLRLFPNLTAMENMEIKRLLHPYHKSTEMLRFFDRLGIKDKINQSASTLSYGEQQRVAIIRALMSPFDWLLLDEPFSHLDAHNITLACSLILQECSARNAGLILVDLEDDQHLPYTRKISL
ncbi:MAG: ATP-binding cassette domain-containing protein [Chitinophagaceae bacterium]